MKKEDNKEAGNFEFVMKNCSKPEDDIEPSSSKKSKSKNKSITEKNQKYFYATLSAIAGLIGIHFNVDYSGWLIFLAFIMIL